VLDVPCVCVKDTTPKSHYDLCVNELVTTEENYVKCLTMLTKVLGIFLLTVTKN